ncbi:MAG: hypothetical protein LKG27_00205 [Clostridiaceae bacterium]|jgi:hypothetical protein|nr:hypothetical protein [Clostridiaceae bacterium]
MEKEVNPIENVKLLLVICEVIITCTGLIWLSLSQTHDFSHFIQYVFGLIITLPIIIYLARIFFGILYIGFGLILMIIYKIVEFNIPSIVKKFLLLFSLILNALFLICWGLLILYTALSNSGTSYYPVILLSYGAAAFPCMWYCQMQDKDDNINYDETDKPSGRYQLTFYWRWAYLIALIAGLLLHISLYTFIIILIATMSIPVVILYSEQSILINGDNI